MTLAAPAGWREDGPDAWGKIPLMPMTRQARYSPLSEPDDDDSVIEVVYGDDQCTPSRRATLTAQPQAQPKPFVYINYAQYDPAFDVDLHPELVAPMPQPAKLAPVPPEPAKPTGIPVEWPTRIVQPVPLSRR